MNWKEFQPKTRYRKTITNTFLSEQDCDMFIMVLKQQWPKHINKLPASEIEIPKSMSIKTESVCVMNSN